MDLLQDQVADLCSKVDLLQTAMAEMSHQIAGILSELKSFAKDRSNAPQAEIGIGRYSSSGRTAYESSMEHKDVLSDANYLDSEPQGGERSLSPEVQIQRLTAQLTAAYNRIAALEEQLLSTRIH